MLSSVTSYAPVGLLLLIAVALTAVTMVLAHAIGPRRSGPVKDMSYESGVDPIGGSSKRFNVRFYLVAMLFLLFDVELLFLYPAVPLLTDRRFTQVPGLALFVGIELLIFFSILVVGLYYERKRGAV